ncbi:hypothetical protein [Emcibacter nanhaiensis]|uniref:Uncharacterized protein n=1 Tax=Emcibacter nanhaiensis TaxID=1505037 RepID=A0A501PB76_9PROT|nr:hypothetical protein [Emcibacter nanhaiensis]TPD57613.1 hypothetical protein FIV46_16005 [Emcibacter nanhaiensis]
MQTTLRLIVSCLLFLLSTQALQAQTVPEETAAEGAARATSSRPVLRVLIRPDYSEEESRKYISPRALPSFRSYGGGEVVINWQDLLDPDYMAGKAVELSDAMVIVETPRRVYFEDAGYSMEKLAVRFDYFNLAEHENDIYENTWTGGELTAKINLPDYGQLFTRYQLKTIDDANSESDRWLVRLLTLY